MAIFGIDAAKEDLEHALAYKEAIVESAYTKRQIMPAIIAAIGSRETRWRPAYFLGDIDTMTKISHGHGPLQIDDRSFPDWCIDYRAGKLTPIDGIDKGCEIFAAKAHALFGHDDSLVGGLIHNTAPLGNDLLLKCIAAAYNSGEGRVAELVNAGLDPDTHTTGHNYGADIVLRARFFHSNGFDIG